MLAIISRFERKNGETRTATKLVHAPAKWYTVITKTTKNIVAYHQERTPWNANVNMEMAGMEDTLKLMELNIVKILTMEN